jgi:hypothetical protein
MIVFDVTRGRTTDNNEVRGGWVRWDGVLASAHCGTLYFAKWSLATLATAERVVYVGLTNLALVRQDKLSSTDMGTAFTSSLRSPVFTGGTLLRRKRLMESYLIAKASATASLDLTIIKDFGLGTVSPRNSSRRGE